MSTAVDATSAADVPAPGVLHGRVVLVVGAHGALGSAAALACARAGATVVLLGRKVPKLNRVHDAIVRSDGDLPEPVLYPLDLEGASADDYAELAQRIEDGFGRLDGVLHCAADFPGLTPLEHADPAAFARALHVNLTARWWLTQACLPLLRRSEDSAVVFVVDDGERVGRAYWGGYGIAQAGVVAMLGMLHEELANSPVRVSGLQPGPMRTPLRTRAYLEDHAAAARDPADLADACVTLLAPAGTRHRGGVWNPVA